MASATPPLSRRQGQIFDFIRTEVRRTGGVPPSLKEISAHLGLSKRSFATVCAHVRQLETKGYIRREWNRARSIVVVVNDDRCPTCGQAVPVRRETAHV